MWVAVFPARGRKAHIQGRNVVLICTVNSVVDRTKTGTRFLHGYTTPDPSAAQLRQSPMLRLLLVALFVKGSIADLVYSEKTLFDGYLPEIEDVKPLLKFANNVSHNLGTTCSGEGLISTPDITNPACYFLYSCSLHGLARRGCCSTGYMYSRPAPSRPLGNCDPM